jgi:HAD superfamily hydrolase (TIGR01549 family)
MRDIHIGGRTLQIAAISLDLDDTLWPIAPTIERAEACLHAWFETHFPAVATAYPVPTMRALRERIWLENPALQHDFTTTRLMSLRVAMLPFGALEADVHVAFELFFDARNDVTLFPGALASLQSLAAHWPVVALTNGNADLSRIGLERYFHARIDARSFGAAKPDRGIFHAACAAVATAPKHMLHIGDHAHQDVFGALNAGMQAAWITAPNSEWPQMSGGQLLGAAPHLRAESLSELCASLLA